MLLGLDISTSCIGYCVLSTQEELIDVGYIDLHKEKCFYQKCDKFVSFLDNNFKSYDIRHIWVEEPVKMFQNNASMAQTITKLQRFNAVCCYMLYLHYSQVPGLIMPASARKLAGIKVPKKSNTKMLVLEHVQRLNKIPNEKWVLKRTGRPKDFCFDMADAFIVAVAGFKKIS